MITAFRWMLRLLLGFLAVGVLVLIGVYYFATRSIPDYSATWRLEGLTAPVEIVRNNANVPHIFGETDADVFYALGFAHAQDRLWQMTMLRRTAQGRLSEIFGDRTVQIDELMRRFDIYSLAAASYAVQDAETRLALEAYSSGVNASITLVNERAMGRGAPELFLFQPEIAAWQPADSLAVIKLMGVQLSSQLQMEVLRARLSLVLSDERLRDILPDDPTDPVAALPEFSTLFPDVSPDPAPLDFASDTLSPVAEPTLAGASNAWAAAPSRSAAGGTLLANDPHLIFSAPTIWYLARLELSSGGVIGATIPGVPVVLAGRSDRLGWAITSSYLDDLDVYVERLNPDNAEEYQTPDGWKAFQTRRSIIRVKDQEPRTLTLRWTDNGPVLPGTHYGLGTITPAGHVTSIAWTLLDPSDTSMSAAMRLMQAGSVDEALAAGALYMAPSQNLLLADREGIATQLIGAMPRRDPRHQTEGRMPAPGWLAENRWQGYLPYQDNPRVVDPETGIVGNTNNKITDAPFPRHVAHDWGDTQRIQRWLRLMQVRDVHTRESFIEAQLDTVSHAARTLLPLVGADLWFTGEAAPEGTRERQRQRALSLLAEWNGEMNEHLPEPLIYAAWMRALQERLIRDELGPLADSFPHVDPVFIERVFRDIDGASVWCDIIQSSPIETCVEIARMALDDALLWLEERYGRTIESWRWGDAHQATHDHQVLGDIRGLSAIVNIRQSTSGGDFTLMRGMTAGRGAAPFHNVHGAGYRGVYDFADPDSSVFITSTGQSGHPLSRHYDNLGDLWRRGEYIPMSLDPQLARAGAVGVTTLLPESD
jgi:penicillin G amidase